MAQASLVDLTLFDLDNSSKVLTFYSNNQSRVSSFDEAPSASLRAKNSSTNSLGTPPLNCHKVLVIQNPYSINY